jgi:ribosome-binding protein aMBF1 (putative translation factor)
VKKRTFPCPTVQFLYDRYVGDDPKRIESYELIAMNAEIAQSIYDLRTQAGLSQRELAKKVGTTASVICRLEDADYEGHSLLMLKRIAEALNKRLQIRFVSRPRPKKLKSA